MVRNKNQNMPAFAHIDARGDVDLRALPVGTRIVTTGITKYRHYVKENHARYVKENRAWFGSDGGRRSDHSLAEELNEQARAGCRISIKYIPVYPVY